ncbi:MAG: 5-methyltetrahydropteroyltriglutamate--homocysteine S-methyltransferase [Campylobacterales bacterium]|nr:5-methyltetrahydropteroyltriglutamate--homocysteine S-methyltransferase [Campylobacterales bacterium]
MTNKIVVLGFPRIGEKRELKTALENYWKGNIPLNELESVASELRLKHWIFQRNAGIETVAVNDFSFYDNTLDLMIALGAEPERFRDITNATQRYFTMARGDDTHIAMEMTKWFNTNYHYIVPELGMNFIFGTVCANKILGEYREAKANGFIGAIQLIGPITFLGLSKCSDDVALALFDKLLEQYSNLLDEMVALDENIEIVMHEPFLSTGADAGQLSLVKIAYKRLGTLSQNLSVATYFEHSCEATAVLVHTPIKGLILDFVHGVKNSESLELLGKSDKHVTVGIVDGRNVWKNNLEQSLKTLEHIETYIPKERLSIGTSCSLLHVPYTLKHEENLEVNVQELLAFAQEKLGELSLLGKAFFAHEKIAFPSHPKSTVDEVVQSRLNTLSPNDFKRSHPYAVRQMSACDAFDLPPLPTTTIGSFPQTAEVRALRQEFKKGLISKEIYDEAMKNRIASCVAFQESIDLDVLVHGEFERNDMVEYFGEQLSGFAFSQNGWVQSYGSRCVKPPLLYGDVSRPRAMTVEWSTYAQSLTDRPMKGMLTGPVTILNWSFVRDDQPRSLTATQIALAIRDEVDDLQRAGIKMIQVDEAAFKEGYPLRRENRAEYEKWALNSFLLSTAVADKDTQIHTHMCYSEFTDIIKTIEAMDADVISIETSRSGNRLLRIFKESGYTQEVGPGVYDIHSPRIPSVEEMKNQIHALLEVLPASQLWINPDCGLKTRGWSETEAALKNMVEATKVVRVTL